MTAAKAKKTVQIKPLLVARVRCVAAHASPWLQRLYVMWASVPPDNEGADAAAAADKSQPQFQLGITDDRGYLSPLFSGKAPDPVDTHKLIEKVAYLFYFVRHPDRGLADRVLAGVNGGSKEWGEPLRLELAMEQTGKDKAKKPIKELVLKVPESPDSFVPKGGDLYQNWLLFRDMPNAQCDPVTQQVRRLQFHLGALRYPVGNSEHPYYPQDFAKKADFPNCGVFDIITWSSVLRFQRDAKTGEAFKVSSDVHQRLVPGYEPAEIEKTLNIMAQIAHEYRKGAPASIAPAAVTDDAVVDTVTADAMKKWIDGGLRKPGKILTTISSGAGEHYYYWMHEDAIDALSAWSDRVRALGFEWGIRMNHTYRDARVDCLGAGYGRAKLSIHKSGLAVDLRMRGFWQIRPEFPVDYVRQDDGSRVSWRLYGQVKGFDPALSGLYAASIMPWHYDETHSLGGTAGPEKTAPPGGAFLNITAVAKEQGYRPIHSFQDGWFAIPEEEVALTDASDFQRIVQKLVIVNKQPGAKDSRTFRYNDSTDVNIVAFKADLDILTTWLSVAGKHSPAPEVTINPTDKADALFIKQLRKNFAGKAVTVTASGGSEQQVTVGKDTVFPNKDPFVLQPVTSTLTLKKGDKFLFPYLPGAPIGLEWWHFQMTERLKGHSWLSLLEEIGWAREGLASKKEPGPYGHWGLGYTQADLAKAAQ